MPVILKLVFGFLVFYETFDLSLSMWNLHNSNSQKELVDYLKESEALWDERVAAVMLRVDRGHYCSDRDEGSYADGPMQIGYSATISAPHMHAYALQKLQRQLVAGSRALDVGSGSGYLSACMALLVGPTGSVLGVEHIPQLLQQSIANVKADQPELLQSGNLKFVVGDGRIGYPESAPYDAIHVGAAAEEIPQALIDQLKPGGRLVLPVGPSESQIMTIVDKHLDGSIVRKTDVGVRFIPLTDKDKQL